MSNASWCIASLTMRSSAVSVPAEERRSVHVCERDNTENIYPVKKKKYCWPLLIADGRPWLRLAAAGHPDQM
jgi:hypothetical protein